MHYVTQYLQILLNIILMIPLQGQNDKLSTPFPITFFKILINCISLLKLNSSDTGINDLISMTKEGAPIQVLRHQPCELEGQKLNKIASYPVSSRRAEFLP